MIIDELFRPEVSPTHPEIQQFMRSFHFSLLLQQAPLEAMLHAAGLSVLAWVLLSERYHVHTRSDEECDRLLHAYHLDGAQTGDRPHAADVVDGLDVLRVALTHHAAG